MELAPPKPQTQYSAPTNKSNDVLLLELQPQDFSYLEQLDGHQHHQEPTPNVGAVQDFLDPSKSRAPEQHQISQQSSSMIAAEAPVNNLNTYAPSTHEAYIDRRAEYPAPQTYSIPPTMEHTSHSYPSPQLHREMPKVEPPKEEPRIHYPAPEVQKEKPVEFYRGYPTLESTHESAPAPIVQNRTQQAFASRSMMLPNQGQMVHPQMVSSQTVPTIVALPSSQQVNQVQQTHQQIASIHNLSTQQVQQTKEMVASFDKSFNKLYNFMESIDKRLSRLESTTDELRKNQQRIQERLNATATPSMPYFIPSSTPLPMSTASISTAPANFDSSSSLPFSSSELETAAKMQQMMESDAELAKRLQAEMDLQEEKSTKTKKPDPKVVMEECPICQKKFNSKEIIEHVNECLEKAPKDDKQAQGFFARWFAKKAETANAEKDKPAEVPLTKKPTTTQTPTTQNPTVISPPPLYPSFPQFVPMPMNGQQMKGNGAPTSTPFFYPGYQGQPVYYMPTQYPFPQQQQPTTQQPKK